MELWTEGSLQFTVEDVSWDPRDDIAPYSSPKREVTPPIEEQPASDPMELTQMILHMKTIVAMNVLQEKPNIVVVRPETCELTSLAIEFLSLQVSWIDRNQLVQGLLTTFPNHVTICNKKPVVIRRAIKKIFKKVTAADVVDMASSNTLLESWGHFKYLKW